MVFGTIRFPIFSFPFSLSNLIISLLRFSGDIFLYFYHHYYFVLGSQILIMLLLEEETFPFMMHFGFSGHSLLELHLINASIGYKPRIILTKPLDHLILIPSNIIGFMIMGFCFHFRFGEFLGIEWFHFGIFQWRSNMILFTSAIDKTYTIMICNLWCWAMPQNYS